MGKTFFRCEIRTENLYIIQMNVSFQRVKLYHDELRHSLSSLLYIMCFCLQFFSFPKRPGRLWGSPSLLTNLYPGSFPGVKRPGREVTLLLPSNTYAKDEWRYTSTPPPHAFMAWIGTALPLLRL
jgi:hypothetical protein